MNKITLENFSRITLASAMLSCCISCASMQTSSQTAYLKVISSSPQPLSSSLLGYDLAPSDKQEGGSALLLAGQTGNVSNEILSFLSGIKIPFIQFELGRDEESLDWRDFINNAPGKPRFRPSKITAGNGSIIDTRFGIDEFLRLKRALHCEGAITVNVLEGLARKSSVREAAERAAGLVAYCNSESGAYLPASYAHWPSIRARNGNPLPVRIEYVRLGFRPSSPDYVQMISDSVPHLSGTSLAGWYIDCLTAYIERIRNADPDIKIMLDGQIGGEHAGAIFQNDYIRNNIDLILCYKPSTSDPNSREQIQFTAALKIAQLTGKPAACMSWGIDGKKPQPDAAVDCAIWLNNMFRNSDLITAASMESLLGTKDSTSALLINPGSKDAPTLSAAGEVMALYARCHGDTSYPVLNPNLSDPSSIVSGIDVAVTSTEKNLFVHAVNSSRENRIEVDLDCSGFNLDQRVEMILLEAAPDNPPQPQTLVKTIKQLKPRRGRIVFDMPPGTISITIASRR